MKVLLINTNTIKSLIAPIGLEYIGEYLSGRSDRQAPAAPIETF